MFEGVVRPELNLCWRRRAGCARDPISSLAIGHCNPGDLSIFVDLENVGTDGLELIFVSLCTCVPVYLLPSRPIISVPPVGDSAITRERYGEAEAQRF